ncbi:hypothetical protein Nepgr_013041 [Nepenthes gracilis]|uniref:Uncharacterized protein n=1 Tax=Nepenthes gracilis TaxID=150966 RepID=A0AAD3SI52_NEPGR|nr:hypothetical protein Nepgr_013041 [Nepenthes gracilis]
MSVGHVILERPWLYDLDVTIQGCSNFYSFVHKGKKIRLYPLPPKPTTPNKERIVVATKGLHIINPTAFEQVAISESVVFTIIVLKTLPYSSIPISNDTRQILQSFQDVFAEDLPNHLPPLRKI